MTIVECFLTKLITNKLTVVATAIIATAMPTYMRGNPDAVSGVCVGGGVISKVGFELGEEVVIEIVGVGEGVAVNVGVEVGVGLGNGVDVVMGVVVG